MRPSASLPRAEHGALLAASWALAAFGALCLLLTAVAMLLGARPVVVRTGSMVPELPIGTVAVVRSVPAAEANVGDVAAVVRTDGRRIMHRVVSTRPAGGDSATIVLKGDANRRADPPLTVSRVERPLVVVPWAGKPIAWLDNPWMQYWLGVLTGGIGLALLGRRRRAAAAAAAATTVRAGVTVAEHPATATQRPVRGAP